MRLRATLAAGFFAVAFVLMGVVITGPADDTSAREMVFFRVVRSVAGGNTPLFFHGAADSEHSWWFQPVPVYAGAALQSISTGAAHLPSLIAGALNIALVFVIADGIGGSIAAFAAALILLLTSAHRLLIFDVDAVFPATFVLFWMIGVLHFLKRDSLRALAGAAMALGVCVYSHAAGPLTAAFLWILTLAITWRRNRVRLAVASAVFISMWLPAAGWFYLHPETYPDTFGRWFALKAHLRNPVDGLRAFFNPNTLGQRASFYWGFWDPSWLVLTVFPAAPLTLVALFRVRHLSRSAMQLLIGTALVTPLAGATFGVEHYLADAAAILPVLAILAGLGVDQLVAVLVRRQPLEDDVVVATVEGWHDDDALPRT